MKKRRLLASSIIILLTLYLIVVLIAGVLPTFLQATILSQIHQKTDRTATLNAVQLSVLPLAIQLQEFALQEKNGQPFASIERTELSVSILQSLKQRALIIDKIILVKPVVHIIEYKNGSLNIDDLSKHSKEKQQSNTAFPLTINKLSLTDGTLTWHSLSNNESIQALQLTATNLSTLANERSQLQLQLDISSGGQLNWQTELTLNPLQAKGHIELSQLKLPTLPSSLPFELTGRILFNSDYQLSYANQQLKFTADKSKLELNDFQYSEKKPARIAVKVAEFAHDTDMHISYVDKAWLFTASHAKTKLHDFEFLSDTVVKLGQFQHETDFKIDYAHDAWRVAINDSKINAQNFQLNYANAIVNIPAITLSTAFDSIMAHDGVQVNTTHGQINSHNIQLSGKNQDQPLLEIPTLTAQGIDFNLANQAVTISSFLADGAVVRTGLNSAGQFNFQTLLTSDADNPPATNAQADNASSKPWAIGIKQLALTQSNVNFVDQTQQPPVSISFAPVDFKLTDYDNKTEGKLPFTLNTSVNKTGSIQINGDSVLKPFSARMAINATGIDLTVFQPYIEKFIHLDMISGQFATDSKLTLNIPDNQPLDLDFTGDASIANLITRDQIQHKDFITWKNLNLKNIAVDLSKNSYTAAGLIIDHPYARVTIKKDKTINFSDVLVSKQQNKKTSQQTSTASKPVFFKLANIKVIEGSSDFTDNSLILPFAAQIESLDGGASNISSESNSTIKFSLKGDAYDLAPVDIDGQVSPYLGNYDVTLNFAGMPMPLMSPYMVQFAGYKVENGKMSLKLQYKVNNGELTANNNILIDQFELGEKVDNPKAVSLPLELAVALLKDSDGIIKLEIPITGSLDKPEFSIGALISDALVNALSKVISAPFHALAELVDGNEEEMSTVSFSAGKTVLDKKQQDELTVLATLLKERPVLALSIKGTAFQTQDWPAIREAALDDILKKMRAEEMNKHSNKKTLAAYIDLSDSDRQRLTAQLFIEKFPNLAKKSLFGTPELIDSKMGDFHTVAIQQLSAGLNSDPLRLRELAIQRARAIASYLVQQGVTREQIFILDPEVDPQRDNNEILSRLELRAR